MAVDVLMCVTTMPSEVWVCRGAVAAEIVWLGLSWFCIWTGGWAPGTAFSDDPSERFLEEGRNPPRPGDSGLPAVF